MEDVMNQETILTLIPLVKTCVICGTILFVTQRVFKIIKTTKIRIKTKLLKITVQQGSR